MDNQQGSTEFCSKLSGSLEGRRVWGRMETCMPMAELLCWAPETTTTLSMGYTPLQKVKRYKKKKKLKDKIKI